MKLRHDSRSIDQRMGSELAAADPKWGVATLVVAETHPCSNQVEPVRQPTIGLWCTMPAPCGVELVFPLLLTTTPAADEGR